MYYEIKILLIFFFFAVKLNVKDIFKKVVKMKYKNINMFSMTLMLLIILFLGLMSASVTHAASNTYVIKTGDSADLGNGYFIKANKVDVGGNQVWLEFGKDGTISMIKL
jgi:hypothetical protein